MNSAYINEIVKNTFKYHVLCTDGKISVRNNLLFYLFFTVVPFNTFVFISCRPFVVSSTFSKPTRPVENIVQGFSFYRVIGFFKIYK